MLGHIRCPYMLNSLPVPPYGHPLALGLSLPPFLSPSLTPTLLLAALIVCMNKHCLPCTVAGRISGNKELQNLKLVVLKYYNARGHCISGTRKPQISGTKN